MSLCELGPSKLQLAGLVCAFGRQEFFVLSACFLVEGCRRTGRAEASTEVSPIEQVVVSVVCVGRRLSVLLATKSITNSFSEDSRIVCVCVCVSP